MLGLSVKARCLSKVSTRTYQWRESVPRQKRNHEPEPREEKHTAIPITRVKNWDGAGFLGDRVDLWGLEEERNCRHVIESQVKEPLYTKMKGGPYSGWNNWVAANSDYNSYGLTAFMPVTCTEIYTPKASALENGNLVSHPGR